MEQTHAVGAVKAVQNARRSHKHLKPSTKPQRKEGSTQQKRRLAARTRSLCHGGALGDRWASTLERTSLAPEPSSSESCPGHVLGLLETTGKGSGAPLIERVGTKTSVSHSDSQPMHCNAQLELPKGENRLDRKRTTEKVLVEKEKDRQGKNKMEGRRKARKGLKA